MELLWCFIWVSYEEPSVGSNESKNERPVPTKLGDTRLGNHNHNRHPSPIALSLLEWNEIRLWIGSCDSVSFLSWTAIKLWRLPWHFVSPSVGRELKRRDIELFIHACMHARMRACLHSFVRSFVYSFIILWSKYAINGSCKTNQTPTLISAFRKGHRPRHKRETAPVRCRLVDTQNIWTNILEVSLEYSAQIISNQGVETGLPISLTSSGRRGLHCSLRSASYFIDFASLRYAHWRCVLSLLTPMVTDLFECLSAPMQRWAS